MKIRKKLFVSIDPGADGAVVVMDENREILLSEVIPNDKDGIDHLALYELFLQIGDMAHKTTEVIVAMELVHSLGNMSARSNFSFGKNVSIKETILKILKYDYQLIPPREWQKRIWIESDMVYEAPAKSAKKKRDTKATSLNAAKRLFPGVDMRKNSRCRVFHNGIVDAVLLAEYARLTDNED